jgi:IclR family acetate operon transcriptional repressor
MTRRGSGVRIPYGPPDTGVMCTATASGTFCVVEPGVNGVEPKYPIESVDNALRLLSMFVSEETVRVKDAADALGVATGTAHRLLAMLLYRGYVTQSPLTKAYEPGPMLLTVGLRASARLDLTSQARPYLERLSGELEETIHLAMLQGPSVLFIDGIESSKALKVASRSGSAFPAHCTSVGKAQLAALGRDRLFDLYPDEELVQVTPRSISSRTQLLVELESTEARGYAVNFGELEDGIGSVGVPVRNRSGAVVAAIGVGAPVSRLSDERLGQLASAARRAADELGADLVVPTKGRAAPKARADEG